MRHIRDFCRLVSIAAALFRYNVISLFRLGRRYYDFAAARVPEPLGLQAPHHDRCRAYVLSSLRDFLAAKIATSLCYSSALYGSRQQHPVYYSAQFSIVSPSIRPFMASPSFNGSGLVNVRTAQ